MSPLVRLPAGWVSSWRDGIFGARSSKLNLAVTVVSPPGYEHSAAFSEVALSLYYGLQSLGHDVVLTTEGSLPGRRHLVLGSNLLPFYPLPLAPDSILYNLEQVEVGSSWFRPELADLFRQYVLWDYSAKNVAALEALGVQVAHVLPLGYVPQLTRIEFAPIRDIDVLFFGSLNPRRQAVLDRMNEEGLRVQAVFGVYGPRRDALIARSKLVLNLHYYEAKVLEMVRISYLLANRCAVLSESSSDLAEDASLAEGVAFASYQDLAQKARHLIEQPHQREQLARRGQDLMRARPMAAYLRAALEDPKAMGTRR